MWYNTIIIGNGGANFSLLFEKLPIKLVTMKKTYPKQLRIPVTIDEETDEILARLKELSGKPKATILGELVKDAKPYLITAVDLLEKVKKNQMEMMDAKSSLTALLLDVSDVASSAQQDINKLIRDMNYEFDFVKNDEK